MHQIALFQGVKGKRRSHTKRALPPSPYYLNLLLSLCPSKVTILRAAIPIVSVVFPKKSKSLALSLTFHFLGEYRWRSMTAWWRRRRRGRLMRTRFVSLAWAGHGTTSPTPWLFFKYCIYSFELVVINSFAPQTSTFWALYVVFISSL